LILLYGLKYIHKGVNIKFPLISDIASTSVITVDITSTIVDAMEMMLKHDHRNVIVKDNDCYKILTVVDILNIQNDFLYADKPLSELDLPKVPIIAKNKNVLDTMKYLNNSIEYICAVNPDKTLYGLVTHTDITSNIDPETLMENYTLSDLLKLRSEVKSVKKDTPTSIVLKEITKEALDNVIIVENRKPIGILTTKDILKLIKNKNNLEIEVSEYMSTPVDTIHRDSSIKEALEFVNKKHYKRVVVVDDEGALAGIITQKELISLTYARWTAMMNKHQEELSEINNMLKNKNKEYQIIASTDSLTGLYNRYKFSELYMSSYLTMTQRENDMSLILLDIDAFKQINDTYGHNVGDKVLIQISKTLLEKIRSTDILCRWGGEEFVILLPAVNLEQAFKSAEKIRVYIEELKIDFVSKITASFGVTKIDKGDNMQDVIDRADKALYLAKHSGRNCVKTQLGS